jgi:two-component sensor histidine kinase
LKTVPKTLHADGPTLVRSNSQAGCDSSAQLLRQHAHGSGTLSRESGHDCSRCDELRVEVGQLAHALELKEAVLQEMHHRVKNTLQIAASSLSLQLHAHCPAEAQAALRVAFDRLHVLAAVHEMLSLQATSCGTIAMRPLLQALAGALERSFSEMSSRVRLRVYADEVSPAVAQAIPLALFANEAITNAFLHAFPDGASGEIVADLRCTGEAVILEVSDTGIGMPPNRGKNGLGMSLMHRLAIQLAATISCTGVDGTGGTVLNMWLPLNAPQQVRQRAAGTIHATSG